MPVIHENKPYDNKIYKNTTKAQKNLKFLRKLCVKVMETNKLLPCAFN